MRRGDKVAEYVEQQRVLDNDLIEERVKQIAMNHFYSVYVRHSLEDAMSHVDENVHWIGSKEGHVAYNKKEYKVLLEKALDEVPFDCVLKVVSANTVTLNPSCYEVSGELELRIPYQLQVMYVEFRFSMVILYKDRKDYSVVSIHTSLSSKELSEKGLLNQEKHGMGEKQKNPNEFDALTGLYTLDYFKKELSSILAEEDEDTKYALLCTDVSHFEKVNNLYGLRKADRMLIELASLLNSFSRNVKLSCRSVADHFLVLVSYDTVEKLEILLKRLCEDFNRDIAVDYPKASPRLGIGVYLVRDRMENVGKIVENSNSARKSLRLQKSLSVVFYDEKIYVRMEKIRKIESIMQEAMEQGEFKVFLQPKYDLEQERIVGAEALTRWIRKDGTIIYPDEFIPIFEQDGFIVDLDFHMLSKVCAMIQRRLKTKKRCVTVSVNQSRLLLQEKDYVSKIAAILAKYNTPPEYIELELTERIFKDNLTNIAQMMGRLKDLGIHWSIDDFGTGYSSLNLLKDLPVDVIKLDKSFLDATETSETSKIIIRKTVELTRELDKKVVCEGVETESQAEYLRDIRCDVAQGYLYARPMPMNEFENLLDKELYV